MNETQSLIDEIHSFDKDYFFDLDHPLVDCIIESFVKVAGIGVVQAVSREAYFIPIEGETNMKSLEAMVKNTGKESLQWGLAVGMYSGLTYSRKEAWGAHDWKNSAVAGAITGATLALTTEDTSHEQIAQCAITGAAIAARCCNKSSHWNILDSKILSLWEFSCL